MAATESHNTITVFRWKRSTTTPAIGLKRTPGAMEKKITRTTGVARSEAFHAQIVIANHVICVPTWESTCPPHAKQQPH